jgi:hypothetical protein
MTDIWEQAWEGAQCSKSCGAVYNDTEYSIRSMVMGQAREQVRYGVDQKVRVELYDVAGLREDLYGDYNYYDYFNCSCEPSFSPGLKPDWEKVAAAIRSQLKEAG